MRALKDPSCGVGANSDWKLAIDRYFNVTYWPYIQNAD